MNEAEILFTEVFGCNRLSLYLNKYLLLEKDQASFIADVLKRRITHQPLPYILGKTEFMGLEFKVTPDVFIPRPETEILVETVLNMVSPLTRLSVNPFRILDMGTGSGCIAISLAKFLPNAKITAIDISREALEVAKENTILNNVEINFLQGDLFNTYNLKPNTYDLIVSNPPYISSSEIESLQAEVQYEPRLALDGGKDGLDFYRKIIKDSPPYLKNYGFLIIEIGFGQTEAIENIFQDSGNFKIIDVVKDYNHIERLIVVRKWTN